MEITSWSLSTMTMFFQMRRFISTCVCVFKSPTKRRRQWTKSPRTHLPNPHIYKSNNAEFKLLPREFLENSTCQCSSLPNYLFIGHRHLSPACPALYELPSFARLFLTAVLAGCYPSTSYNRRWPTQVLWNANGICLFEDPHWGGQWWWIL